MTHMYSFFYQIYVAVKSGSFAIAASTMDSLLDFIDEGELWITHVSMRKINNNYRFPMGKLRAQPIGIIIFVAIMATLGFVVLVQAVEQIIQCEVSEKLSSAQREWLYSVMLTATAVKLILYAYCRGSSNSIGRDYEKDHYFDVIMSNVVGLLAAVFGDKIFWWIDPAGAIILALYTVTNWSGTVLENAVSLVGQTAPPQVLQKLTYLVLQHDPLIRRVDTVRAYSLGVLYFVEVQIELPQNLPFMIGELLQQKIDQELEQVERDFVSLDYERDHKPAHKVLHKILLALLVVSPLKYS